MYATINLPGSSHFEFYGPATANECRDWLQRRVTQLQETELLTSLLPQRIVSNKVAESWRYLDGSRVVTPYDYQVFDSTEKPPYMACGCSSTGHFKSCPGFGL